MDKEILQVMEDSVKLLTILVKRNTIQTQLIKEMSDVGFPPKRIGELLKTSSNNVRVSLHYTKNIKKKIK